MYYRKTIEGRFLERPNRFLAHVDIDGRTEIVHVKNTGRCRELLKPGTRVWCSVADDNPARKTKYDLITVEKGPHLINIDSNAPNIAVGQWLEAGGLGPTDLIQSEKTFGDSRLDFYLEHGGKGMYMEVKGVTLENEGICRFPDAPTERGVKHLRELIAAKNSGYDAAVLFVIQMSPVRWLEPNDSTDPAFGKALREASAAGVQVLAVDSLVTVDSMEIGHFVEIRM